MTLLFGKLVQKFVSFSNLLASADAGIAGASDQIPAAAADFHNSSTKLSCGLVYIGVFHAYRYSEAAFEPNLL